MDTSRITPDDIYEHLATMTHATAVVVDSLLKDIYAATECDYRELAGTLQSSAEVVIAGYSRLSELVGTLQSSAEAVVAGCGTLTGDMPILDRLNLMYALHSKAGWILYCGRRALVNFSTHRYAVQTHRLQTLKGMVTDIQEVVEDFTYTAKSIIDKVM